MSTTNGPFALALGVESDIPNPAVGSGNDFTAVQLQNSSVFVISVLASGLTYTIQPFTAQTVPLTAQGAPIGITPTQNPSNTNAGLSSLTAVWLLAGEQPPMQDGPLTAAAILVGLSGAGIAGAGVLTDYLIGIPSGGHGELDFEGPIQIWSWGWLATSKNTVPASGNSAMFANGPFGVDNMTASEGSSSRLSGIQLGGTPGIIFENNYDQTVDFFVNYSGASAAPTPPIPPVALAFIQAGAMPALVASGTSQTVLGAPNAVGNTVVLGILTPSATDQIVAVTSAMGTFVRVNANNSAGTRSDIEWWVCVGATGSSRAVTVTTMAGTSWAAAALEFSGVTESDDGGTTFDVSTDPNLTVTPINNPSVVLVMGEFGTFPSAGPTSPWADVNTGYFSFGAGQDIAWQIVESLASVTAQWTASGGPWETSGLLLS